METHQQLTRLKQQLAPLRSAILEHPIYEEIQGLPQLRIFMQHHVFAVWDFMSLLKSLQQQLCCVDLPWMPPSDGAASRVINTIVLEEESDLDPDGEFTSHFNLYHRAMTRCGADTSGIDSFLDHLKRGAELRAALHSGALPKYAQDFIAGTFHVIQSRQLPAIAAAFTFGREELLPQVFYKIIRELNQDSPHQLDEFRYYLQRHVELDDDEHGPMAARLVVSLCGSDKQNWELAESAAISALTSRIALWDTAFASMQRIRNGPITQS